MVGNLITLYEHNETEFKSNGLGSLIDAASCSVYEERNGEFELTMEYPVTGRHFSDISMRRIIFAKPNPYDEYQPFRIYDISKPINGIISISAHHLSYDLDGYPLAPFSASTIWSTFEEINRQMTEPWNSDKPPFQFTSLKTSEVSDPLELVAPCSVRAILGGSEGTILDRWPGEYEWDKWTVRYYQNRGSDRGVTIEYGKNLTDLEQEENCDECWTGVYPYYYTEPQTDEEGVTTGGLVQLDEKIVPCPGTYGYSRILVLNLTSEFEEEPSQEELRERARKYILDKEIGSPKVSLTVSFLPLSETTAYSNLKLLEEVRLCDTVHVYFPRLNVASSSTCISTTYNVLTDRYTEIELGEAKSDLASTLAGQGSEVEKQIQNAVSSNNSFVEGAIKRQSQLITGNAGGYVVLHDTNGDQMPDELLVMDHDNIKEAKNIWRFNLAGVGHSSTGYNGDYTTGWTMDGHFNASLITVGELLADIIKAGILSDRNGYNYWNMDTGEFKLAAQVKVGEQTIPEIAEQYANDSVGSFIENTYNPKIVELQKQLDGQIETYYYDYEPTIQNEPASLWATEEEKARHEGDLFYWKTKGYAYRFFRDGDGWKWQLVQDTDITQALAKAQTAQDTADNKRRVFVTTPNPPYDVGDLWVQGPQGDIYRCQSSKPDGGSYDFGDWIKASKYTDDSALTTFLTGDYKETINELKAQDDKKAETWFQNADPSTSWSDTTTKNNHIGDLWYCTSSSDTTHYGKYWMWDGTIWIEMKTEPPQELFDRFDGKAKIFIDTPETPYQPGDLWFQSETSDIMTCVTGRDSGPYVSDDWKKRNKYTDDSALTTFLAGEYSTTIEQLKAQDDRKAETWYQPTDPSEFWSLEQKQQHIGDLWYNNSAGVQRYYRYDGANWLELTTNPPQAVFDRIDGKAQIFVGVTPPTIPYHEGDLWFIDASSDIMTCVFTREEGVYTPSDWDKRNKYISASESQTQTETWFNQTLTQLALFNKLTNNGVIQGIFMQPDGQLYMNASYINSGTMVANRIYGGQLTLGGPADIFGKFICKTDTDQSFDPGAPTDLDVEISASIGLTSRGHHDATLLSAYYWNGVSADTGMRAAILRGEFNSNHVGPAFVWPAVFENGLVVQGGTKNKAVSTNEYGERLQYSYEMASPLFGDIGDACLDENGIVYISLNDIFSKTVNTEINYWVFLQKEGAGDLWVDKKESNYFVVKGTPLLKFSWEVKAKQLNFEYERLNRLNLNPRGDVVSRDYQHQYLSELREMLAKREEINMKQFLKGA